jgi:hypothetical protein
VQTGYEDYNPKTLPELISLSRCASSDYALWLKRQYGVGSGFGGGNLLPVTANTTNLAFSTMAITSLQNTSTNQTASLGMVQMNLTVLNSLGNPKMIADSLKKPLQN